jgi:hypothetical protein
MCLCPVEIRGVKTLASGRQTAALANFQQLPALSIVGLNQFKEFRIEIIVPTLLLHWLLVLQSLGC